MVYRSSIKEIRIMNVKFILNHLTVMICLLASIRTNSQGGEHQQNIPWNESPPLYTAIRKGDVKTVRSLLKNGENVNQFYSTLGTPLYYAVEHGRLSIVKLFLERGANVNKMHPLTIAAAINDPGIVR